MGGNAQLSVVGNAPQVGQDYNAVLADIDAQLQGAFQDGASQVQLDVLICTSGGTFQQLYTSHLLVRSFTIQNLTTQTTSLVTISSSRGSSNGSTATAAQGILLNPAGTAGLGGGSWASTNIDLFWLWWTSTNTSDKISVAYLT